MTALAANFNEIHQAGETITEAGVRKLLERGRGTLLIAHERERAAVFALEGRADLCLGRVKDPRAFATVLCAPALEDLRDVWQEVVLLDGCLLPGEAETIQQRCPRARLRRMKPNPGLTAQLRELALADEPLRGLYRRVRRGGALAPSQLAADCGLTVPQVLTGLTAFRQVGLAEFSLEPFALCLLPPVKCRMEDSPLIRYLRGLTL